MLKIFVKNYQWKVLFVYNLHKQFRNKIHLLGGFEGAWMLLVGSYIVVLTRISLVISFPDKESNYFTLIFAKNLENCVNLKCIHVTKFPYWLLF